MVYLGRPAADIVYCALSGLQAKKRQKSGTAAGGVDVSGSDGSGDESNDEAAATVAAPPQQQDVD